MEGEGAISKGNDVPGDSVSRLIRLLSLQRISVCRNEAERRSLTGDHSANATMACNGMESVKELRLNRNLSELNSQERTSNGKSDKNQGLGSTVEELHCSTHPATSSALDIG